MDDHVLRRPAGLDLRTALWVRGMVVRGKRVDDPRLRPTAEFYVDRFERYHERQQSLRPLQILMALLFAVAFVGTLPSSSLLTVMMGVNALMWASFAVLGPRNRDAMLRRLDVNRPDPAPE